MRFPVHHLCLALVSTFFSVPALATPLTDVTAIVAGEATDPIDAESFVLESPPNVLPLLGEVVTTFSSATAIAELPGSLTVGGALEGDATASATAEMTGLVFGGTGTELLFQYSLSIEHQSDTAGDVSLFDEATLLITSSAGALVQFGQLLTPGSSTIDGFFVVEAGDVGEVSLLLTTELMGTGADAFSETLSLATLSVQAVSEPPTWALMSIAVMLIGGRRHRGGPRNKQTIT